MVEQLLIINSNFISNIIIMDNISTCKDTIEYLKNTTCKVIYNTFNYPQISQNHNADVYNTLPDIFITTDPDLELNKNLPKNFIEILTEISETYTVGKVGFALDISDFNDMFQYDIYHHKGTTIFSHESQFWHNKIQHDQYEVYNAFIDTTFCLYNKKYFDSNNFYHAIRVAGNFTCKHLPWYIESKLFNLYENYSLYKNTERHISTIASLVFTYVDNNYTTIYKNEELFLIDNNDYNSKITYFNKTNNADDNIFDKYLDKNKLVINFDREIGLNGMYFTRKCKHVYCVETNNELMDVIKKNYKNNCEQKYTFSSDLNIQNIINDNNIDIKEISLINVNLHGDEEFLLTDLYNFHKTNNIPLFITFNLNNWNDKNIDRFEFLTEEQKNMIISNNYLNNLLSFMNHTIKIVYFAYLVPNRWHSVVKEQLDALKNLELYETASNIYFNVISDDLELEQLKVFLKNDYPKIEIANHFYENVYEYAGIKNLYDISSENEENTYILYFHSKGMTSYADIDRQNLFRNTISNYKEAIEAFENNKEIDVVCAIPHAFGFAYFNFFWIRSSYVKRWLPVPVISDNRYIWEVFIGSYYSKKPKIITYSPLLKYETTDSATDPNFWYYLHT
jgi:hypothetical protein